MNVWERGGDGAEQAPVTVVEFGPVDLPPQYLKMVTEHDDLEVLGAPERTASRASAARSR